MNVITYTKLTSKPSCFSARNAIIEFTITGNLLKTHFKELARLSKAFKATNGVYGGFIEPQDEAVFMALCERANKVNPARAAKSREKALATKIQSSKDRKNASRCEHEDLGSFGYAHGSTVKCPHCGQKAVVW